MFRPILNGSVSHIESDASNVVRVIESESGVDFEFLQNGRLTAIGYGGTLMLDWERYAEDIEYDLELRGTYIRLESIGDNSQAVSATSDGVTLGLWSRMRKPTGFEVFGELIRAVGEFASAGFIGDQSTGLDNPYLAPV